MPASTKSPIALLVMAIAIPTVAVGMLKVCRAPDDPAPSRIRSYEEEEEEAVSPTSMRIDRGVQPSISERLNDGEAPNEGPQQKEAPMDLSRVPSGYPFDPEARIRPVPLIIRPDASAADLCKLLQRLPEEVNPKKQAITEELALELMSLASLEIERLDFVREKYRTLFKQWMQKTENASPAYTYKSQELARAGAQRVLGEHKSPGPRLYRILAKKNAFELHIADAFEELEMYQRLADLTLASDALQDILAARLRR